eukprot:349677-Chlamydomonas_euryale.AAC.8
MADPRQLPRAQTPRAPCKRCFRRCCGIPRPSRQNRQTLILRHGMPSMLTAQPCTQATCVCQQPRVAPAPIASVTLAAVSHRGLGAASRRLGRGSGAAIAAKPPRVRSCAANGRSHPGTRLSPLMLCRANLMRGRLACGTA